MFGLREEARIYKHTGQKGGKPSYAEQPTVCACRTQPITAAKSSGNAVNRSGDTLLFIHNAAVEAGDKIIVEDKSYTAVEVRAYRGLGSGVHHLEITLRAE